MSNIFFKMPIVATWISLAISISNGQELESTVSEQTIPELATNIKKSLVAIHTVGRDGKDASFSTGFVVSSDGLIATAFHSVAEGYGIRVESADGRELPVTHIHARLEAADLIVLKVNAKELNPLPLGDSSLIEDGQSVVAVGHPLGRKNSVASGLVSRRETIGIELLQLAMSIERGSSGEPVVDRTGKVIGVVTLKSSEQDNVGYAVPIVHLQRMLNDASPIPVERWKTIGRLDADQWMTLWDANWRRHRTQIVVDGYGKSFGGRSLCLSKTRAPEAPYEIQVDVKLANEGGAAGLVFHSDGNNRHYGFYPSAGKIRLTRFSGPALDSWTILHNETHDAYRPGEWNTLKVRVENEKFTLFVNDERVTSSVDDRLPSGATGLVTFRGTSAAFRRYQVASSIPSEKPTPEVRAKMDAILEDLRIDRPASEEVVTRLQPFAQYSDRVLEHNARQLEFRARRMRQLADQVHASRVVHQITSALCLEADKSHAGAVKKPDLLRAALLIALLDNRDVDVDAYVRRIDAFGAEIMKAIPDGATELEKLSVLDRMMFREYGFRGSRFEYYASASSYLNEVFDDREGLPISVSVLYIELAKRVGVSVVGVGLPGHFVVRFEPKDEGVKPQLLDVFNKGKRLTRSDAEQLIRDRGFAPEARFFETQTAVQIADRMVRNLLGNAEEEKDNDRIYRYAELLVALDGENYEARARRMLIRAQTQRFTEAIEDVNWFINHPVENSELDQFYELRAEFERQLERQERLAS